MTNLEMFLCFPISNWSHSFSKKDPVLYYLVLRLTIPMIIGIHANAYFLSIQSHFSHSDIIFLCI